jgi:hypothetical protein
MPKWTGARCARPSMHFRACTGEDCSRPHPLPTLRSCVIGGGGHPTGGGRARPPTRFGRSRSSWTVEATPHTASGALSHPGSSLAPASNIRRATAVPRWDCRSAGRREGTTPAACCRMSGRAHQSGRGLVGRRCLGRQRRSLTSCAAVAGGNRVRISYSTSISGSSSTSTATWNGSPASTLAAASGGSLLPRPETPVGFIILIFRKD